MKKLPRALLAGLLIFILGLITLRSINQSVRAAAARQPDTQAQTSQPLVIAHPAPAAASLSLVYAETVPESNETTLWRAPADQLSQKIALAVITHKQGYPPIGAVSPNGSKIALLVIPPSADERTARTGSGEIWTLNSDGTGLTHAAVRAGWLEQWSPDSQWIVYSRLTPLATPADPQVPFRTEFYRAQTDGSTGSLLLSDDSSYAVIGLGWSADGEYLVARGDTRGYWQISAHDPENGHIRQNWQLPGISNLREITLSPDGSRVLVENLIDGQDTLRVIDLQASSVQAQSNLTSAAMPDELPVAPFQALWRGVGDLWLYHQPRSGQGASAGLAGAENDAILPDAITTTDEFLLPVSWSPNESWLLWKMYPYNSTNLYLQRSDSSALTQILAAQPGNWLTPFGWIAVERSSQ